MSIVYPAIMHRAGFEAFILSLPSATLVRQWRDDSVGKVGGKVFALLDRDPGDIWLKVSDMAYELLNELDGAIFCAGRVGGDFRGQSAA